MCVCAWARTCVCVCVDLLYNEHAVGDNQYLSSYIHTREHHLDGGTFDVCCHVDIASIIVNLGYYVVHVCR